MDKMISVDEALSKGQRMLNIPVFIISFVFFTMGIVFLILKVWPIWVTFVSIILGFILSWLWWSFMITKWRLWAFENVRNVHELKKRAIQNKLIWPDGSIYEKTEIRNKTETDKWNSLQIKFKKEDVFQDDSSIPDEVKIFYSKSKNFFEMLVMIGCLAFGFYGIVFKDNYILGFALVLIGAYFSFKEYKEATNIDPQIILNDKGLKTISSKFYEWKDIHNDEVIRQGSGKNTTHNLVFNHPDGAVNLKIDDFNTDFKKLNKLLIHYRNKYNQSL